jgi:hypothetical protein
LISVPLKSSYTALIALEIEIESAKIREKSNTSNTNRFEPIPPKILLFMMSSFQLPATGR